MTYLIRVMSALFLTTLLGGLLTPAPHTTLTHIDEPFSHHTIGFDIDDTLLFSSPTFTHGRTNGRLDWAKINTLDHTYSQPLVRTVAILREHQRLGHTVYLITARTYTKDETLSHHVSALFGIPATSVYYAKPKDKLIQELGIDTYYGDSDTDIRDAHQAGARGIRVPRHPDSNYRNRDGTPRKYTPGMYGEYVLPLTPTY